MRSALEHPRNTVLASAASTWEVAIKAGLGKIRGHASEIPAACAVVGFDELPIRFPHTIRVAELPAHHRDPFDRLLIAQAFEEGLTLVSGDGVFAKYGVDLLWS